MLQLTFLQKIQVSILSFRSQSESICTEVLNYSIRSFVPFVTIPSPKIIKSAIFNLDIQTHTFLVLGFRFLPAKPQRKALQL